MKTTISIPHDGVRMIAHRGISGLETENTCAAFVAAGNHSHYGIETDVWVTRDGDFVLLHDGNLERVAGVTCDVTQADLEDVQKVRLYKFPERETRSDLVVPVLSDYIRICRQYEKKAVLELKGIMTREQVTAIASEIERLDYLDGVIFISFMWDNLLYLREKYPHQPCQFLTSQPCDEEMISRLERAGIDLDIGYPQISRELVESLHKKGRLVNCWTVDDPDIAAKMVGCGVDFITSNILE